MAILGNIWGKWWDITLVPFQYELALSSRYWVRKSITWSSKWMDIYRWKKEAKKRKTQFTRYECGNIRKCNRRIVSCMTTSITFHQKWEISNLRSMNSTPLFIFNPSALIRPDSVIIGRWNDSHSYRQVILINGTLRGSLYWILAQSEGYYDPEIWKRNGPLSVSTDSYAYVKVLSTYCICRCIQRNQVPRNLFLQ